MGDRAHGTFTFPPVPTFVGKGQLAAPAHLASWGSPRPSGPVASAGSPAGLPGRGGGHRHSAGSAHWSRLTKHDLGLCQEINAAAQFSLLVLCFILSLLIRSDDPNFVTEVGILENANETLQPRLSSSYVNARWKTEILQVPGNSMDTWDGKMRVAQLRGL